jgi:hypothetical protein
MVYRRRGGPRPAPSLRLLLALLIQDNSTAFVDLTLGTCDDRPQSNQGREKFAHSVFPEILKTGGLTQHKRFIS